MNLYLRHHFTSSNCMFMQLQGIVFIQLKGNYIIVNFQGNIFTQRKYLYSQKNILIQGNIFIRGNYSYTHSKTLSSGHSRNV